MSKTPQWTPEDLKTLTSRSKASWDRFVRDHAALIFAAVRRKLVPAGRSQDAEDVAQEVFIRLVKNDYRLLKSFDPSKAKLSTWLTIVAASTAIDHLRKNARPMTEIDALPDGFLSVPAQEYHWVNIPDGLLSERQALVLELLYQKDYEVTEAADFLGVDPQTVRSMHHKALTRLRGHFRKEADAI
jgi:RNA polymerase sigma-70 factor (ECF subfamily)